MNNIAIIIPIILPIAIGLVSFCKKFENENERSKFCIYSTIAVSVVVFAELLLFKGKSFTLFSFTDVLNISFKIDGLTCVFASMVSFLWPLAVIYASEYMKHEGGQQKFFAFYIMTFGVTLGIAMSANMLTMYLFYELLTFVTLPLVVHNMSEKSIYAGKKYLIYSVGGASLSFIGMMLISANTGSFEFAFGGLVKSADNTLLFAYLLMFIGFGVKAAVVPLHSWLPGASVAPTPVTALLHAVAVVKSGVFAIIRITFFFVGTKVLIGTWVQNLVMILAIITICYGSWMAVKSKHIKRRLAYSTISQLSYIVFGLTLMTTDGFTGGMLHMVFHALMKIVLFYAAGAIFYTNHKEYVQEIEGYAKKMPTVFALFTISSLSLMGIPPLPGFLSKFSLITAAARQGGISFINPTLSEILPFVGICALMFSAFMTAIYCLEIILKAYFPSKSFDEQSLEKVKEAPKPMLVSMTIITVVMVAMMLFSKPIFETIDLIAKGGF